MRILALDPGTEKTAFLVWDGSVVHCGIENNEDLRCMLVANHFGSADLMAYEMIASYGMSVGREVFETCVWIGRFIECTPLKPVPVFRKDVKLHLCGTPRAKDANVRQAILDLFGGKQKAIGRKASPGPLYGVSSHIWSALGVALYAESNIKKENEA